MAQRMASPPEKIPCDDYMQFKKILDSLRKTDDRINNELNSKLPTLSFSHKVDATSICKELITELTKSHQVREGSIKTCIGHSANRVSDFKQRRETNPSDTELSKTLRKEQTNLRQLQTILLEEEIIQRSALKIYYERCRDFYKSPELVELFK